MHRTVCKQLAILQNINQQHYRNDISFSCFKKKKPKPQTSSLFFSFFFFKYNAAEILAIAQAGGQQMTEILFMEEELKQ